MRCKWQSPLTIYGVSTLTLSRILRLSDEPSALSTVFGLDVPLGSIYCVADTKEV